MLRTRSGRTRKGLGCTLDEPVTGGREETRPTAESYASLMDSTRTAPCSRLPMFFGKWWAIAWAEKLADEQARSGMIGWPRTWNMRYSSGLVLATALTLAALVVVRGEDRSLPSLKSLIDCTDEELIQRVPSLRGVQFDRSPAILDATLDLAGKALDTSMESFVKRLPSSGRRSAWPRKTQ